jgi:pimeloyl-ACP methyl ester carboxylesterase
MPELRTAQDFRETPTRTIAAAGAQFAYRELGPRAGVPLALLRHLGANLDNWGPRIVDGLAQDRRVITVDYRSAGDSTGTVRNSMEAMAADILAVTGPVLIVHGDSGRMVPPQNATALARHLPTATVTVFPDSAQGRLPQQPRVR